MADTKRRTVTRQEVQTMVYLNKRGYSNVGIANLMKLDEKTVRNHIKKVTAEKTQTA
jgi:DNA-binding NarL/FixJ family response regulator